MLLPALNASADRFIEFLIYTSAATDADPETRNLSPAIDKALEGFYQTITRQAKAADAVIRARAVRDYRLRITHDAIHDLEFEAGHQLVDPRTKKPTAKYQQLFVQPVSALKKVGAKDRAKVYDGLLKRTRAVQSVAGLKAQVTAFAERWAQLQAAESALADRLMEQAAAASEMAAAKKEIHAAARKTHGLLESKFPQNKARVESYFVQRSAKAPDGEAGSKKGGAGKSKKKEETPPAGGDGEGTKKS